MIRLLNFEKRLRIGLFGLIIALVVAFIVVGFMSSMDNYIVPYVRSTPESSVELIVKEITPDGIVFALDNPTEREYIYGYSYRLYAHNGRSWVPVPFLPDRGWMVHDVGLVLSPVSTTDEIERTWEWAGSLPSGEYKFSMSISPSPFDLQRRLIHNDEYVFDVFFTLP